MSAGSISILVNNVMDKTTYVSSFNKLVRIKQSKLKWLKENKPKNVKTMAGFLDIIINDYKNEKCTNKK